MLEGYKNNAEAGQQSLVARVAFMPLCLHVATLFSPKPAKHSLNRSTSQPDISPQLNAAVGEEPAWVHSSSTATQGAKGPSSG